MDYRARNDGRITMRPYSNGLSLPEKGGLGRVYINLYIKKTFCIGQA